MHRFHAEGRQEPQGKQIQVAVDETVQSELGLSIFACLMMYNLEAGIFSQVGNVAVHFTVPLNVFHYVPVIGFQSAVEVVQIMYSRNRTCSSIE